MSTNTYNDVQYVQDCMYTQFYTGTPNYLTVLINTGHKRFWLQLIKQCHGEASCG